MRVTVVGSGRVGRALTTAFARSGHAVTVAVRREPDEPLPDGVGTAALDEAAADADLTVLAVPFDAVEDVVPRLGLPERAVLVDATNPFGRAVPDGHASGAAHVAAVAGHGVRVVKAFDVLGAEHMADPVLPDGARPLLPVAGDDADARSRVVALATELGFDAVDVGGLAAAELLESAARYWGLLAHAGGLGRGVVLVAHRRPLA